MHILLSNDDGYFAPGLAALAQALSTIAKITVIAPERDHSGASNSLTITTPLSVRVAMNGFLYVNGTPTDCVHLAMTGYLQEKPDFIVTGINNGANMGDDTLYSGTVAAATEGYLLGIPSLAFSLCSKEPRYFQTAGKVALEMVQTLMKTPPQEPLLLSVNVPDIPFADLKGKEVTRLGKRHPAEKAIFDTTPRGQQVYWLGPAGEAKDAGEGTDFYAVSQHKVSITPLQIDLTAHRQMAAVASFFGL